MAHQTFAVGWYDAFYVQLFGVHLVRPPDQFGLPTCKRFYAFQVAFNIAQYRVRHMRACASVRVSRASFSVWNLYRPWNVSVSIVRLEPFVPFLEHFVNVASQLQISKEDLPDP